MLTLLVLDASTYEKVTTTIITYFWMFSLTINKRLNWLLSSYLLMKKSTNGYSKVFNCSQNKPESFSVTKVSFILEIIYQSDL